MSEIMSQNTGNPVLDSLVNLATRAQVEQNQLEFTHDILLKLAAKEPGGLRRMPDTTLSESQPQERPTAEQLASR